MKAAMLRDRQTVSQAGLSPHETHCHQYLAIDVAPGFPLSPAFMVFLALVLVPARNFLNFRLLPLLALGDVVRYR
jgi:hypothetical protein